MNDYVLVLLLVLFFLFGSFYVSVRMIFYAEARVKEYGGEFERIRGEGICVHTFGIRILQFIKCMVLYPLNDKLLVANKFDDRICAVGDNFYVDKHEVRVGIEVEV